MEAGSLQVQLEATLKTVLKTKFNLQEKFSKSTTSTCNQENKENSGYEHFDTVNVAVILFYCCEKRRRLQIDLPF
jgi:hypothetical protein